MAIIAANRRSRIGILPLLSILCVGLVLFAIASVIVLALIPVYLSSHNDFKAQPIQSPIYQATYPLPSGNTYQTGPLTQTQLAYLLSQYQTMINNNPQTAGSVLNSPGATVSAPIGQTRKRQTISIAQFLNLLYRILFRPETSIRRQAIITNIIQRIMSTSLGNYSFLILVNSTANQSSTTGSGYAPVSLGCVNGQVVVASTTLYPDEASWLQQRAPVAETSLRTWLSGIGLSATDYNANTKLPRLALAISGGGYRSLLTGAGVIQAMDGRDATKTVLSGLFQGITYLAGTSGGGWLVTSFASNNYSTISSLRDSLWIQRFQYFFASVNPVQPDYPVIAIGQIIDKKKAGFPVSAADVWSRDLAFQLIQAPNGGPNVTFDQITSTDVFKAFSVPLPIVTTVQADSKTCIPVRSASIFEFTPFSFGSWDSGIRAFTPIKFLGTRYNNGQIPANGQCVTNFDNAGFVLGTGSFLFNGFECRILPDGSRVVIPDIQNATAGSIASINAVLQSILTKEEVLINDYFLSAIYPNPFLGSIQSPSVSSLSDLNFVDGGETNQNIPLWPLIQPPRAVDIIFASDNSADTSGNLPNGSQIQTTYMQAMLAGIPFPFIPDPSTFVSQGRNIQPSFFGCNQTNVPLIIYLPNTNISYPSGISTFTPTYSESDTRGLIQNGLNIATRSNSTPWARCVACAVARRKEGLFGPNTSAECLNCFKTYCYN